MMLCFPEYKYNKKGSDINQNLKNKKEARDGIRTRDPRLGKAILHH